MSIRFDSEKGIFHLQTKKTSYLLQIGHMNYLLHLYWGARLRQAAPDHLIELRGRSSFSPTVDIDHGSFVLDAVQQEYPTYGSGDFRQPAVQVQLENGSTINDLRYRSHRIFTGKPALEGLPSVYAERPEEAETLEIDLWDETAGLNVVLSYTVFPEYDAITRSARIVNGGDQMLRVLRALSMNVDFPDSRYELLQLSGAWARERIVHKRPLVPGIQGIESRRGSSSHMQNPFLALLRPDATEDHGEVYGFNFVYSGSFSAHVEVEQFGTARVSVGINPFDFSWKLEPGESFQTPEVVMVYASDGLGAMSRTFHKLYRERLCRGVHRDKERPILINNWEATYFQFNADKIEDIARVGAELGIELFVLDDGWFGKRDDDKSSLGDWFVDKAKLPGGIDDLAKRVNALGLQFGLWFEPEMVSPVSELYRKHPDWCLHVPDRRRTEARNQLILDYSRQDVRDYIVQVVSDVLKSAPISYVKWDMNRNMTEIGSDLLPAERQKETAHRYMLGLYEVLEKLTSAFPHILFESCSGGGGRFDPGMLYYMPQTWTSDNTDAVERLKIQYGTSIVYPISSIGAHVSAVPNHQTARITPLETRGHAAMSGNFGYELDLTKFTDEEKEQVKSQVETYKSIRSITQFGDFYRLLSPFEGNETAWMFVTPDQREAVVFHFQVLAVPNPPISRLRLKGLREDWNYEVEGYNAGMYGGDQLTHAGLILPRLRGDYQSGIFRIKAI